MKRIALIDGDVIAHIACKNRWERLQYYRGIRRGDPRFTFKPSSDEEMVFSPAEGTRYINESWLNFKNHLKTLLDNLYLEKNNYLMAVKADTNFRDDIYSAYKAHRRTDNHNEFVSILRAKAVNEGYAIFAEGREADDYLRMWSIEAKQAGLEPVICSIDKDLKCIPGKHWDLKKNELIDVSEAEAMRFYFEQLLKGDPTDNVPGVGGVGPVRAAALLEDCETLEEYQETICMVYEAAYGEEWESYLLSNGKMIHIQQHENDHFTISDWAFTKEYRKRPKVVKQEETKPSLPVPSLKKLEEPVTVVPSAPKSFAAGLRVPTL